MSMEILRSYIKENEGVKTRTYTDTTGHKTIGAGFNLETGDAKSKLAALGLSYEKVKSGKEQISKEQVDLLMQDSINRAVRDAVAVVPGFDQLNKDRQIVLIDLAYNLGRSGLRSFSKMLKAISSKNWDSAADELRNSRWYVQTGRRARKNVEAMRTGKLSFYNSEKKSEL